MRRVRDAWAWSWQDEAACRSVDPALFWPEEDEDFSASARMARKVCAVCPVRVECLTHAMTWPEREGIWGGLSSRQRGRLRRQGWTPERDEGRAA